MLPRTLALRRGMAQDRCPPRATHGTSPIGPRRRPGLTRRMGNEPPPRGAIRPETPTQPVRFLLEIGVVATDAIASPASGTPAGWRTTAMHASRVTGRLAAVAGAAVLVLVACSEATLPQEDTAGEPSLASVANPAAKVTLSTDALWLAPSGAKGILRAQAFDAAGNGMQGTRIKWWGSNSGLFTFTPDLCTAPCQVEVTSGSAGVGKIIIHEYGGTARDTARVVISADAPPDAGPAPQPDPPPPPPPPPPSNTAGCLDGRTATITLTGLQSTRYSHRDDLPQNALVDATTASWTSSSSGSPIRAGNGSDICWHGGSAVNTYSDNTSWSTFHDTYAFQGYGRDQIVEDFAARNFGDGIKWMDALTDNWTVRRVHLQHMHDDCVETDWLKGGRIEDVLFEGCYVFLAARPRSGSTVDGSRNTIAVDRAVVWMEPMPTVYSGPAPSTGAVFKIDNSSSSRSPRLVLRNIVLRVDVKPGVGNACLNPAGLVVESVNNTVVWLGQGDYPCLPLPAGWTLTRDKAVWDAAVNDWNARHTGSGGTGTSTPVPVPFASVTKDDGAAREERRRTHQPAGWLDSLPRGR
jgi:hypothetical protein